MLTIRKEIHIGADFTAAALEAALGEFRVLYGVRPERALCSPDVIARYCALFERSADIAHLHSSNLRYEGIPIAAAVLPAGTVAFEGTVDDVKMGDW
jgi:hypothetical protein